METTMKLKNCSVKYWMENCKFLNRYRIYTYNFSWIYLMQKKNSILWSSNKLLTTLK